MKISIVIPVLDEERRIEECLTGATAQPGMHECIVVDGGSGDRTVELARRFPVRVLSGPRGRGRQLNCGAEHAGGDVLLFLHADVVLPERAASVIERTLGAGDVVAGAFRTWTVPDRALFSGNSEPGPAATWRSPLWRLLARVDRRAPALLLRLADIRSLYSRVPYGDQALFVRRDAFRAVGGFPALPLMEDLCLSRDLRRLGRIRIARERVRVSGRRFASAPLRQTFWVNVFPLLFAAGVSAETLARLYGAPR